MAHAIVRSSPLVGPSLLPAGRRIAGGAPKFEQDRGRLDLSGDRPEAIGARQGPGPGRTEPVQVGELELRRWKSHGPERENGRVRDDIIATQTGTEEFRIVRGSVVEGEGGHDEIAAIAKARLGHRETGILVESDNTAPGMGKGHARVADEDDRGGDFDVDVEDVAGSILLTDRDVDVQDGDGVGFITVIRNGSRQRSRSGKLDMGPLGKAGQGEKEERTGELHDGRLLGGGSGRAGGRGGGGNE